MPAYPLPHLIRIPESRLSAQLEWPREVGLACHSLKEVATRYAAHVGAHSVSGPQSFVGGNAIGWHGCPSCRESEMQNAPSGSDHIALATFVAIPSMMESGLLRLLAVPRSLKNDTTEPSDVFSTRTATPARSLLKVNGATR